jgi:hypothetical protein
MLVLKHWSVVLARDTHKQVAYGAVADRPLRSECVGSMIGMLRGYDALGDPPG